MTPGLLLLSYIRTVQVRQHEPPTIPNRLDQQFAVSAKNRVWACDLTFVPHANRLAHRGRVAGSVFTPRGALGHKSAANAVGGGGGLVDGVAPPTPYSGTHPS